LFEGQPLRLAKVDGRDAGMSRLYNVAAVLPGRRVLTVEARWSNRKPETAELTMTAEAGRSYYLSVQEFEPSRDETWGDILAGSLAEGAIHGAAPVVVPVAAIALLAPPPDTPPAGRVLAVYVAREEPGVIGEGDPVASQVWPAGRGGGLASTRYERLFGGRGQGVHLRPGPDGRPWQRVKR
jgi:hypothetical protein